MTAQPKPVQSPVESVDEGEPTAYTENFPCAVIEVSPEAFDQMLALADDPPPPTDALRESAARYRKVVAAGSIRTTALDE